MFIETDDGRVLNLLEWDALQVVLKRSYHGERAFVSALLFDVQGDIVVEELICELKSPSPLKKTTEDFALEYLEKVTSGTQYVTVVVKARNEHKKLNLARFHALTIVSGKSQAERCAATPRATGKRSETVIPSREVAVVMAVRYDESGDVLRTHRLASFDDKEQATEYLKSIIEVN